MTRNRNVKSYEGCHTSLFYNLRWSVPGMFKKMTIKKILRTIHTLFDWKFRIIYVRSRPWAVRLEAAAICNLKCVTCDTRDKKFEKGQAKIMTLKSFRHICKMISHNVYRMTFYVMGEPLMNKNIFKMVEIASKENMYTSFASNFTLMKKTYLKELFDSGLDWLSVALDGFTQETYSKYRVCGNVENLKNGIRMVMEYKKLNNYKKPFLTVYCIDFFHVRPEISEIKRFCTELNVDEFRLRHDNSNWDNSYKHRVLKKPIRNCYWPWICLTIDADGSVYPCYYALKKGFRYGNLLKQDLDEIWNNNYFMETRKYIKSKIKKSNLNLPCYTCSLFN